MNNINEYLKKEKTKVSQEINKKNKIYLDTKYWVEICDVTRGVKNNDDIRKIYTFLKDEVQNNKVICPLSQALLKEILKQSDANSLIHTIQIIDELSQGIIICHEDERLSLELFNLFYDKFNIETDKNLEKNFWCRGITHMYGITIPYNANLTDEVNYIIQREYFTQMQKYTLFDFFKKIGIDKLHIYRDSKDDISLHERIKQASMNKQATLHKLYMVEISGVINYYKDDIEEIFQQVINHRFKQIKTTVEDEQMFNIELITDKIYDTFNEKEMDLYLPTLDVGSMLHAKIRWNKTQKYKQGDMNDIRHATTALPYYDYFFTEKSLHNMIRECKYDEKYSCIVASKNNNILEILEKLDLT